MSVGSSQTWGDQSSSSRSLNLSCSKAEIYRSLLLAWPKMGLRVARRLDLGATRNCLPFSSPLPTCQEHPTIGQSIIAHAGCHRNLIERICRYLTVFSPEGRLYQVGLCNSFNGLGIFNTDIWIFRICLQSYLWLGPYGCLRTRQGHCRCNYTKESSSA